MSSSILSTSIPTRFTLKSFFSSLTMTQGCWPCWPIRVIIGLDGMPNTGNGLMMPITGFSGVPTREIARERSYSNWRSRPGSRNGIASFWSSWTDGQAQVKFLAVAHHLAFHAVQARGILGIRVRLRIVFLDGQFSRARPACIRQADPPRVWQ